MKQFKLNLGNNELLIHDKFTLILGKFHKDLLNEQKIKNFIKVIENLNLIPLDLFLDLYKPKINQAIKIEKVRDFLKDFSNLTTTVKSHFELLSDFLNNLDIFNQIMKNFDLENRKEKLIKELELALAYNNSSELSAIKDLISKLKLSIDKNKQKLNYFEEDFNNTKNQVAQLTENIKRISKEISEMTQLKKTCFDQINKITRTMEERQNEEKIDVIEKLGIDINLPNSEKIRLLQKKAQDAQFEVKQLNKALNEVKNEYELMKPEYDIYLKDYNNIVYDIEKEESKLNELNKELNERLTVNENYSLKDLPQKNYQLIRPIRVIETEYKKLCAELENLNIPNNISNSERFENLNIIIEKFQKLHDELDEKLNINIKKADVEVILDSLDAFRALEVVINKLEQVYNKFLMQINLTSHFKVVINDTEHIFMIESIFYRKVNQMVNWQDLTTPERIFSVITFFISLKLILNYNPIIFSNIFLPSKYNKRGSIFRTIQKILPLFEHDESLKEIILIFVLSNLEMKKEIKNLNVINIKES